MKLLFLFVLAMLATIYCNCQIPVYNSYPKAKATIYLDFDGEYIEGTSWNFNGPLLCGPANLTTAQITEIFNRVSEDYRPFNVNITTDSMIYEAAPNDQRVRILFTITSDWYGSAGGVSYVGSFNWGDNTPAFVFTALLNYNTKFIAEAASHEAGHTLGLRHQSLYDANCSKTSEYNPGAGNGEIGWAPIMGVAYYRNQSLWHNGADPYGCNDFQDDLGIITSASNGFGYRPDDYGNDSSTAASVELLNNQFLMNGVIENSTDKDMFRFIIPADGTFHLDASPYSVAPGDQGSDLDIKLELMDKSENIIDSYNPESLLSASIDTLLNSGTYYLRVQGVGNKYAPGYASIGSYNLAGNFSPINVLPLHQLKLNGSTDHNFHKLFWIISADEKVLKVNLELSTDGNLFRVLSSPEINNTSYQYLPMVIGEIYYRVHVFFADGKDYYSNIIQLRNDYQLSDVHLMTTVVGNNVQIASNGFYNFIITGIDGKIVLKGSIIEGNNYLDAGNLTRGIYIIKFNNGKQDFIQKFMKF